MPNVTLAVYARFRLVAASFLDLGQESISSIYAIFDPAESWRSLGIFTMLKELEFGRQRTSRYYYPVTPATNRPPTITKSSFQALEWYDWQGAWRPLRAGIRSAEIQLPVV